MSRFMLHMAYDGSAYRGWQIQPGEPTVQGLMQDALTTLLRQEIAVVGAGRTDTGVHASSFVAHFDLSDSLPQNPNLSSPQNPDFVFKLNRFLPPDVVVYGISEVADDFHARFSATSRSYHYHISSLKPLFRREYSHHIYGKLDLAEMEKCCRLITDASDFTSFSKLHTDVKNNICNVEYARWIETTSGYRFEIRANRFLRNMVRSLVGTLLDVGQGKSDHHVFQSVLDAKDRGKAGQSAPAKALFLVDITYPGITLPSPGSP